MALVLSGTSVWAQTPPAPAATPSAPEVQQLKVEIDRLKREFDALRQEYDRRLETLEQRLGRLAGPNVIGETVAAVPQDPQQPTPPALPAPSAPPVVPPAAPPAGAQEPPPPTPPASQQAAYSGSKVFNPDTSVIGNFIGVAGKNPMSSQPPLDLSEAEVAFQAVVDPYARADVFLSATPQGLDVEEGYVTFNTLPAGLLLKAGKMRAQFGKVNAMHTHALPWADRPLVTQNLLGGEEGLSDAGLSLSKLIPVESLYVEATGEVYRGNSDVFQTDERSKLAYLGRLRAYRDLTESTNLDVGLSFAHGPTSIGPDVSKQLFGIDVTYRWRPLRRAIYHQFVGRTEVIWSHNNYPTDTGLLLRDRATASGFYASADYQFARRWFTGVRVDRSERSLFPSLSDNGASFHVTFRPTEFSLIRGQYRRTNYAEGISANEVLFQINFSIGAHGAHLF